MWYWIAMILLIAGSLALLAGSYIRIKKGDSEVPGKRASRRRARDYDEEDEYDYDEPDDEDYDRPAGRKKRQAPARSAERLRPAESRSPKKRKRQWKIILEDIDSWEKYSFIFYDTVGIGRGKDGSMYEKYLPLVNDGRVSKQHCVIASRGDKLYLRDQNSRNGTYLNGERVYDPIVIQKDDIIGVGGTRLEIQRIMRESDQ